MPARILDNLLLQLVEAARMITVHRLRHRHHVNVLRRTPVLRSSHVTTLITTTKAIPVVADALLRRVRPISQVLVDKVQTILLKTHRTTPLISRVMELSIHRIRRIRQRILQIRIHRSTASTQPRLPLHRRVRLHMHNLPGIRRIPRTRRTYSVTTALLLTLTTTSLTTTSITLTPLQLSLIPPTQPIRNKLIITRIPLQLTPTITRPRTHITRSTTENRLTHPITLLMQHPIRRIHPQPTPRPRTTTRNNLRTTKLIERQSYAVRRYDSTRHTVDSQLRIKLIIPADVVDSYFDTVCALLENPTPYRLFSFSNELVCGLQFSRHASHLLCFPSPISKRLRSPCHPVGVLREHSPPRRYSVGGVHVPSLVTESALAGGPSYSIRMSILR